MFPCRNYGEFATDGPEKGEVRSVTTGLCSLSDGQRAGSPPCTLASKRITLDWSRNECFRLIGRCSADGNGARVDAESVISRAWCWLLALCATRSGLHLSGLDYTLVRVAHNEDSVALNLLMDADRQYSF